MSVPDAAAERLHALYVDELVQSLMPPVHPMVDRRQTQALIRHARATGRACAKRRTKRPGSGRTCTWDTRCHSGSSSGRSERCAGRIRR